MSLPTPIAIDGPAASGKSTVAKQLAAALGAGHVDTGQMYRAFTAMLLRRGINPQAGEERILAVLPTIDCQYQRNANGEVTLLIDGEPVADSDIRTPQVAAAVSYVARIPGVREWMVSRQRDARQLGLVVVEGRDIGTVVFPEAAHKFFVTASPEERARRRLAQGGETVDGATLSSVAAEIAERDRLDSTRAVAPLRPADDAIIVDTTDLPIADVVEQLRQRIEA